MDWFSVSTDIIGILGDLVLVTSEPLGMILWIGSTFIELVSLAKAWDDLDMGDPTGVIGQIFSMLVKAGRLPPLVGSVISIADLVYNLAKGFYWQSVPQEAK